MKALYDRMAKRRSYGQGGNHGGNPNGGSQEMTPDMVSLWHLLTKLQNQKSEKEGYEQADFDDSLFGPQDTITPEAQFKGANGGRMYEHGGTHPTEEEKQRKETSDEKRARNQAAADAFKDFSKNDKGKPLTQAQADIVFNQWPEDARKLGMAMLDGGLLSRDSLLAVARGGRPLNLESFNKYALKNGDASNGYGIENVTRERRKFFKQDGSYELKDKKSHPAFFRNIQNALTVGGPSFVKGNSFSILPQAIKYYGPVPEKEVVPEEVPEVPEEIIEEVVEERDDMEVVEKAPPKIIKKETSKEVVQGDDEVVEVEEEEEIPLLQTSKPNFGDLPLIDTSQVSDRLGSNSPEFGPTSTEVNLNNDLKYLVPGTNEKGGKLYAQGGKQMSRKQMSPALMAYLKRYQQNFATGGRYRVKR